MAIALPSTDAFTVPFREAFTVPSTEAFNTELSDALPKAYKDKFVLESTVIPLRFSVIVCAAAPIP